MGSMTKVIVGLSIVERIGTCSRRVSEQLFRTTPTMLLKKGERVLATGNAMRSNRFAGKFPVLGIWICGIFLRSPKPALKPLAMEVVAVTPTLNQKRVWRRPYSKPIEIKTKRAKKAIP
jgi:hypothetical protein